MADVTGVSSEKIKGSYDVRSYAKYSIALWLYHRTMDVFLFLLFLLWMGVGVFLRVHPGEATTLCKQGLYERPISAAVWMRRCHDDGGVRTIPASVDMGVYRRIFRCYHIGTGDRYSDGSLIQSQILGL